MAFIDRVVEYPGRYTLTDTGGTELGTYDLTRSEGEVTTEGTLLNANNLNTLTQLDSNVLTTLTTAGMASGTYQNDVSDAIDFLTGNIMSKTSGDWRYIEIGGLFIGATTFTGALAITTAVGNVYQTASSSAINLPFALTENLYSSVQIITNQYSVIPVIYGTSTSAITYRAISALSRATANYTIKAFVLGVI